MNTKRILTYLGNIAKNNTREWFYENKKEYQAVRKDFEADVERLIGRISDFDDSVAHLTIKDCTYRFNRDTRFSPDKSPYKRHFGAYIAAHGKKALHGGYYIHLEPGNCLIAFGTYWLPTNILTSCRNEIMANIEEWLSIVESKEFFDTFGKAGEGKWGAEKGFGLEHLKTCPKDFPKDYEHMEYLRMKDYCAFCSVPDNFFSKDNWLDEFERIARIAKPMLDFTNSVIDDYE